MDKDFWDSIARNDYKIPGGHTLQELTKILFGYLPSTDPELRDEIAYSVYASWLEREMYTKEEVSTHVKELLTSLEKGIGETESDSVFLRAFSVLFLAEIVHNDNKKPLLEKEQAQSIFKRGIWYLDAEKDPRGHVPVKGWADALAHTADLMLELGRSRHLDESDLWEILNAISAKMVHSGNHLYMYSDDERLARAVIEVLRRDLIPLGEVELWATSFLHPDGRDWKGAFEDEGRTRAFQNIRNLLRSIYLELVPDEDEMPNREALKKIFFSALKDLRPF
ncbi:MAG: DUF2785 domain-containing protein [Chloroflexi bacterium]|nr:MAG: DUF2785 domain-containing protein [Chloroflexota bacterium]